MTHLHDAWTEVGDRVEALALKLKLHTKEELSDHDDLQETWTRLRAAVGDVVDSFADVSRDPAVRADVKAVADSLSAALEASVAEARSQLRRR